MMEDLEDLLGGPPGAPCTLADALPCTAAQCPTPELVSEVYGNSPAVVRTRLLECLLRPVGPLALATIAAGAFGHLLHRLTGDATPITLDDIARISSEHVLELARYVEQCSPHELVRLGSVLAASPMGMATVGGSALLLALGAWSAKH
ncbi:MAG TPA: hypothetical protein VED83_04020 [Burkholderiaceae bacterium]|nr:hypothetical protein [Burkholderiaceae bacterium]